ncbi:MAG TPA: hypothetical protein PLE77_01645 [Kiritimatiellia bacterium]|nr:hypothetical protein [Kiritimatiellia bacterium]
MKETWGERMQTEAASYAAVWILRVFLGVNVIYVACLAVLVLRMVWSVYIA